MFRLPRLPKEEARVILCCALLLVAAAGLAYFLVRQSEAGDGGGGLTDAERREAAELRRRMEAADTLARRKGGAAEQAHALFPFDPNHADSATLRRLGLAGWQVRNLMKYRRKGGRWRSPDDFSRLYGLSEEEFRLLRPYIRIADADRRRSDRAAAYPAGQTQRGERPDYEKIEKYAEGTKISLSQADTTALKRIPGVGSYYASKIVAYRERLGGFVSVAQVDEIEGLPPGISRWFTLEANPVVRPLRINHADFRSLVRHPYLSYEQTKVVVNYVRRYGPLRSWRDLRLYPEFSEADFRRLAPYFVFD